MVVELCLLLLLGLQVRESAGGWCDEPAHILDPASDHVRGCDFLEGGGYAAMPVAPLLIFALFALAALRFRKPALMHWGFVAGLAFLALAFFVDPASYPWV